MRCKVGTLDVSAEAAISARKTSLVTPVLSANILPCKEKVTVSTGNTSDETTTLIVLTLREERTTNTWNTPNGTVCDIKTLESSSNISLLITTLRPILSTTAPTKETPIGILTSIPRLLVPTPRAHTLKPR